MPTHADAGALWFMSAMLGGWLAWRVRSGRIWTGVLYGTIHRSERPTLFWILVGLHGLAVFIFAFLAAFASVSLPNETATGMR